MQLDQAHKGFSFSKEGPLDMRMNPASQLTAQEIVNSWPEEELGKIFREFGEEPRWRRAAAAIASARKNHEISTTSELADILVQALGYQGKKRLHPATLVFQALRISVNDELGSLERALHAAIEHLSPGGRMGVISFHSLEDRIVKNVFKAEGKTPHVNRQSKKKLIPSPKLRLLTKKPLIPTESEARVNPRARSAKLRFVERRADE